MISYEGLYEQLQKKGITKTDLTSEIGISSRTIAKTAKGEKLSKKTLERIAAFLDCDVHSLCREISNNAILQILKEEKEGRRSGRLYHEL